MKIARLAHHKVFPLRTGKILKALGLVGFFDQIGIPTGDIKLRVRRDPETAFQRCREGRGFRRGLGLGTTKPGTLGVQGYKPTAEELAAMGIPDGENVVWVPRALLDEYAASLR